MTKNADVLKQMISHLISQGLIKSDSDLARKANVNKSTLSQILNGKRRSSNATFQKINAAFGNIFNPEFWQGKSDILLLVDAEMGNDTSVLPKLIATTISAKDETIRALREQIKDLQQYVNDLRRMINMFQYDGYKVAETPADDPTQTSNGYNVAPE